MLMDKCSALRLVILAGDHKCGSEMSWQSVAEVQLSGQRDGWCAKSWTSATEKTCSLSVNAKLQSLMYSRLRSIIKKIPWPETASELDRPSDRRLSAKLVPTFADRGCHVVNVTDLYGRILGFLELRRYFFFQAAPQLYS
jgi:hypothetical protein